MELEQDAPSAKKYRQSHCRSSSCNRTESPICIRMPTTTKGPESGIIGLLFDPFPHVLWIQQPISSCPFFLKRRASDCNVVVYSKRDTYFGGDGEFALRVKNRTNEGRANLDR